MGKPTGGTPPELLLHVIQDMLESYIVCIGKLHEVTASFSGFPSCTEAVNGTYVPILYPHQGSMELVNCKDFYSLMLKGIIDFCGCFTQVFAV